MPQQKTAIITGSTSGIGLGIAEGFAKAGINLVINGIEAAADDSIDCKVAQRLNRGAGERAGSGPSQPTEFWQASAKRALRPGNARPRAQTLPKSC